MYNIILAHDDNGCIGNTSTNDLPWRGKVDKTILKKDLEFFRKTTLNSTVIMGRKTWESIPKKYRPLPKRRNIVLTRNPNYPENVEFYANIQEALKSAEKDKEIFIIGGKSLYDIGLSNKDMIKRIYLCHIPGCYDGDVFINIEKIKKNFGNIVECIEYGDNLSSNSCSA